ncbi:SDR family oxidoreductase [Pontibacter qinzhouensis]|uniref:SDR family oxidoreductase n=1 Tax=Pontibacter qinzhouensis TaxID=2603253 RepID=A0A5C8KDF3_9BACT|nr:SDR family oxidoreductase [Pontibacter qinzhouensis]TXK52611.1 SDR family oxidoreductase [Pontibacter qinzhouensis]
MRILLTGANGYIGKRVLPLLLEQGHEVVCCVRDKNRFPTEGIFSHENITLVEIDFLKEPVWQEALQQIDVAYYLIHSMSDNSPHFEKLEEQSARHFVELVNQTEAQQIIYLGGIINDETLSKHLASRKKVEEVLRSGSVPVTALKAGIIVGSGSSSFEIIRDLTEKLPVMITPKWLKTRTQPIAIRNVLEYLVGVLLQPQTYGQSYDIGGPDVLTYKQMLLQFAKVRELKRFIFTVPVMTPRLSSYWLYFVTSTSYKLATNLVNSMKVEVVAKPNNLNQLVNVKLLTYKQAVELAFQKIDQNSVVSSWKDSLISSYRGSSLVEHIHVPTNGCFFDKRLKIITTEEEQVLQNIWSIGGKRGWYYGNWLWSIRGFMDKMVGGVGLRRGRTNPNTIHSGDTLDFWRVLVADKQTKRLLLYAEMKLPGEAWLEFKIIEKAGGRFLQQTATFRPKGLLGRLYWYAVLPFHHFVFNGMSTNLIGYKMQDAAAQPTL